jgi:hypothetical protein
MDIKALIRDIPDFRQPGIPLFATSPHCSKMRRALKPPIDALVEKLLT